MEKTPISTNGPLLYGSSFHLVKSKTVAAKLWDGARAAARKITLEPAIILVAIMSGVGNGVKVQTNLQLWKVCRGRMHGDRVHCAKLN